MENTKKKGPGLRHLKPCIRGYVTPSVMTPVLIIFEVALEILIPLLMAALVDGGLYRVEQFQLQGVISRLPYRNNLQFVLWVGGLMVLASLLSLLCGALAARTSAVASMGFAKNLRERIFGKILQFSFKNTDRFQTSSLVIRATTDVNNLQNTYQMFLRMMFRAPIMMVLAAIMAFRINVKLSYIFVIALPLVLTPMLLFMLIGRKRFKMMFTKMDTMNSAVQEDLIGMRVVKSFVRGPYEIGRFRNSADDLMKTQIYAQKLFSFASPIQLGVMWGATILLWLFGGRMSVSPDGNLPIGELTALIGYSTQVIASLQMVSMFPLMLSRMRASLDRINEVFEERIDIESPESDLTVETGEIEFDHVDFSYSGNPEVLNLKDVSLHILPGQTVGIIGGTGEGKSTLVQMIPRLYDVLSGSVRVSGHDVREYGLRALRDGVSMVLQKNMLFSGSIHENMRWGDPDATDEQIREACRIACADGFVTAFPDGYDTDLGQGGCNVSGGQKQRLCIARALLKKPKILILDDSTSAVDTATEAKIRDGLKKLTDMTKIIIAQRITSIMGADQIIVMEHGAISDVGTHEELLRRSLIYREVYESQVREEANA
ncbi:MAG: ABC transporter ATP-binding protein [Clostridia bacterium]|nr:ABC transporter ATP-binding protein [Clostridia bacterium]MBR0437120.1 ABC transporter ATP-binding protein [Clostridia bacterium]